MNKNTDTRKVWLNYFNRTLRESGMISEVEYRRLKLNISQNTGALRDKKFITGAPNNF